MQLYNLKGCLFNSLGESMKRYFEQNLVLTQHEKDKVQYLLIAYSFINISILFFILKNTIVYGFFNTTLIALFFLFLFIISPFLILIIRSYFVLISIALIFASTALSVLVFEAGAFNAPGALWLSALPLTFFILLGSRGGYVGGTVTLLAFGVFYILKSNGIVGPITLTQEQYELEKTIDIFAFALYVFAVSYVFVRNEEKSKLKIQLTSQELDNLLKVVIHDISNPASVATMSLEQFESGNLDEIKKLKQISRIKNSLNSINFMLSEVRTLKSMRDGKLDLINIPLNVETIILSVLNVINVKAESKDIKINYKNNSKHNIILGNEVAISNMIISNFLTNAIKFSTKGSVIDITLNELDQYLELSIEDYGIGIPKNILNKLWDSNAQTSRNGTSGESGTGYGMPIAKAFLDKMEASVVVETKTQDQLIGADDRTGTKFILRFKKEV